MVNELDPTDHKSARICVIGMGNVGLPTAYCIHKRGYPVYGYDVDKRKIMSLNPITAFCDWAGVPSSNIYVICVNTGWKDKKSDMSNIFDVCNKIAVKEKGSKPLVSIESTVSVGTCRKVAEMFSDAYVVHVPHRFWAKEPEEHGVVQGRVIGALNDESMTKAKSFYESLGIKLHPVSSLEVAEFVKITENAYRYVQIAFVEQLRLLCEANGIPFEEVRKGANTKWNVNLLEARDGIKGECLPKDIRYLASLGDAPLLEGAIETDRKYLERLNSAKNTQH
jgi:UDP-N-acetyl-D-mannosaminuronic acid dehydrogenase